MKEEISAKYLKMNHQKDKERTRKMWYYRKQRMREFQEGNSAHCQILYRLQIRMLPTEFNHNNKKDT